MWRLQQLMKRCAHTLRVQLMDYEGEGVGQRVEPLREAPSVCTVHHATAPLSLLLRPLAHTSGQCRLAPSVTAAPPNPHTHIKACSSWSLAPVHQHRWTRVPGSSLSLPLLFFPPPSPPLPSLPSLPFLSLPLPLPFPLPPPPVRQLELQVKAILDSITHDESTKRQLITGVAVDKAEQLSECSPAYPWGRGQQASQCLVD